MALVDTNVVIRNYLLTQATITALIDSRLYIAKLPQNTTLPAVAFFSRGGSSSPYIPGIPTPSIQFDCWASRQIDAREVYRAIYDALQGIQNVDVVVGADTYQIMGAREEVQGQDLQDAEFPDYYKTLGFFEVMIRASLT